MICKNCGYESNENFLFCPSCGAEEVISQNQNNLVARQKQNYDSNMPNNFKGFASTFAISQDEIKMSRNLNGGNFVFWLKILLILSFFFGCFLPILFIIFSTIAGICNLFLLTSLDIHSLFFDFYMLLSDIILFCQNISSWLIDCIADFPFIIIISGFLFMLFVNYLAIAKITINSNGIYVKIFFKKYFIAQDKINSIICKTVTRQKTKYFQESLYDIFIIMKEKDKKLFNKLEIDTGLCYKNKIHVDYLIDMFNERLRFI